MAFFLVLILRLVLPISILRWPLTGAILSILADNLDSVIFRYIGWGTVSAAEYQLIDKYLDLYYLTFEALIVYQWREKPWRDIGMALFLWRFAGVLFFEASGIRKVLFFAPNIFENFYLVAQLIKTSAQRMPISLKYALPILLIIALPKVVQEYVMHYKEIPLGLSTIWRYVHAALY